MSEKLPLTVKDVSHQVPIQPTFKKVSYLTCVLKSSALFILIWNSEDRDRIFSNDL